MIHPSVDQIKNVADSKYSLVVAAAKRARQIVERKEAIISNEKPVSVALRELLEGTVTYRHTSSGIK